MELLIVIVVIAILAAITIVAYTGIQQRAKESAVKTELASVVRKVQVAMAGSTVSTSTPPASLAEAQVDTSGDTTYGYEAIQASGYYCVSATNASLSYYQTSIDATQRTGTCPTVSGLVGWWPLNGDAREWAGSGTTGVAVNAPTPATGQNGLPNNAFQLLAASQQYFNIASFSGAPIERGALSVWVKPQNSGDVQNYIYYGSSGEDGCTGLPGYSLATCAFVLQTTTSGATSTAFSGIATNETWQHLVAAWEGATTPRFIRTYLNGVQVGTGTLGATPALTPEVQYIGRPGSSSRMANAAIDDVRMYNRPLSDNEITALYQAGAQ